MLHGATVVHHIPGRLRVRLPKANRDPDQLRQLREFVQGLGGVHRVEINPTTGSILVHYEPESHDQLKNLMRMAQQQGGEEIDEPPDLGEADELVKRIEQEADFLAAHSEVALHIVNGVKALNDELRKASDNMIDLKVVLPAGLAVWAFLKHGVEASTPLWVSLAMFSFNSFVALHRTTTVHVASHRTEIDTV